MNEASSMLLLEKNFEQFSKKRSDVRNHECSLQMAGWHEEQHSIIRFEITSNRFLRGMVRIIVAHCLKIGEGKMQLSDFKRSLKQPPLSHRPSLAPAHGLKLSRVLY